MAHSISGFCLLKGKDFGKYTNKSEVSVKASDKNKA